MSKAAMYQPTDENSHLSLTHGEEEMGEDFNPSISESGYDPADHHEQWPTSPGGRSTCSSQGGCGNVGRQRKKSSRQSYNKNNVRMDQYINRDPESITAKELRVLIPQMFLAYQHPQKEIGKSKVKGLWEKGNQPMGWPTDVNFRDPNNNPKMGIVEMKIVFRFLKGSLNPNPKPHTLKVKCEPRTPMVTSPIYQQSPPNLDVFHSDAPHYSSHLQGTMYTDGATSIQVQEQRPGSNFFPSIGSPPSSVGQNRSNAPIPLTVDCHEEEEQQAAMDHGVQLMNGSDHVDMTKPPFTQTYRLPETVSSRLESFHPSTTLEPMAGHNQPVEVITQAVKQDGVNIVTDFTVLHNVSLNNNDVQVINFEQPQNQGMIQLIQPQSSEEQPIAETVQPSEQKECIAFADSIQEELGPILKAFGKIYDGNGPVVGAVRNILCDTFGPLFEEAKKTKESCMKFSKFSSQLQEILKRYARMAGDANDIIGELNNLRGGFGITYANAMHLQQQLPVMEDHCVPYVGSEVVVMKVTNDGTSEPKFIDSFNGPYIPTIAELEARALRKQQEIEGAPDMLNPAVGEEMIHEEKVKVEKLYPDSVMSPMCQQLHGLNVSSPGQEQDPEKDLGISLKRSPSWDDESSNMMNHNQLNELLSEIDFLNQTEYQVSDATPAVTSWEGTENVVSQSGKQTQAAVLAPTQALDSRNGQPHFVTQASEQADLQPGMGDIQPSMVDMQQAQCLQFIGNSTTGQSVDMSGTPSVIGPVSCTHNDQLEECALQATLASAHSHFGGLVLEQPYQQRDVRAAMNDYETRVINDVWGLFEDYEINNPNQSVQTKQTDNVLPLVKPSPDFTTIQMMDSGSPVDRTYTTPCMETRVCSPGLVLTGIKTENPLVFKVPEPCPPVKKVPKAAPVIPLTVLAIAEEASQDDVQTKRRTVEKGKKYGKGSQRLPYGKGMHQGGRHEKRM